MPSTTDLDNVLNWCKQWGLWADIYDSNARIRNRVRAELRQREKDLELIREELRLEEQGSNATAVMLPRRVQPQLENIVERIVSSFGKAIFPLESRIQSAERSVRWDRDSLAGWDVTLRKNRENLVPYSEVVYANLKRRGIGDPNVFWAYVQARLSPDSTEVDRSAADSLVRQLEVAVRRERRELALVESSSADVPTALTTSNTPSPSPQPVIAPSPTEANEPNWDPMSYGDTRVTSSDAAVRFGVNVEALRKRLKRWREAKGNRHLQGRAWLQNEEGGSTDAKYVYRLADILPFIRDLWVSERR